MKDANHNVMGMDIMTVVAMIFIMVAIVKTHTSMQYVITNFESFKSSKQSDPTAQDPSETAQIFFGVNGKNQAGNIRFKGESEMREVSYAELLTILKRESPSAITIFADKQYPAEHFGRLLLDASDMQIRIQLGAAHE